MRIYIVSTSDNSTRRSMRSTPASGDTQRHFQVARSAGYDPATGPGSAELSEGMDMTYERRSPTQLHSMPTSPMFLALNDVAGFELYMA